jgi:hypothetical protein
MCGFWVGFLGAGLSLLRSLFSVPRMMRAARGFTVAKTCWKTFIGNCKPPSVQKAQCSSDFVNSFGSSSSSRHMTLSFRNAETHGEIVSENEAMPHIGR